MAETASIVRLDARGEDFLRTGPGSPAGRYLRQFWQPIYHAPDLPAVDILPPSATLPSRFWQEETR